MSSLRIYDLPTRVFHWTFAGLFVAAYTIGSTVDDAPPRFVLHMLAGGLLAAAVLLRLVWGVAGTRHARLSDFSLSPAALVGYLRGVLSGQARTWAGHNPASSWAALVMMGLGLGMAATGLVMVAGVAPHAVEEVHEVLANAFLAVALLHVAGVLVHVLRHRDALPLSMVTGRKRGIPAGETDVRPHMGVAMAFVAVLVAVGAGVASRYDAGRGQVTLFGQTLMLREADEGSGERSGADDEQAEHEAHAREERAEDVPHG
ncbi:cytochrome b/b6 domain-containing protein [Pseudoxanthomonas sp. 3HH-4]|uniref:cytochrome b/b6 domain-containing protein n=1 Tax=Pseudoxanthomonas sp. 3HH-4 TaxID=1690214 RepID=UPI001639711F|nr:cytochrome b/b6 domain-containing protein [Pseudoxanthomonas sp. 3HH-4]